MATTKLTEDEGIFSALREKYGSVDAALASNPGIWGDSSTCEISDESSLREALAGPQRDELIGLLVPQFRASAKVGPDSHSGPSVWDDTDIVHVLRDDGPSTLLGELRGQPAGARAWDGDYGFDSVAVVQPGDGDGDNAGLLQEHRVVGEWGGELIDTNHSAAMEVDVDI